MATTDRRLLRAALSIALAAFLIGASFGVFARAAGIEPWLVCGISVFVFAGGAQFLVIGLISTSRPRSRWRSRRPTSPSVRTSRWASPSSSPGTSARPSGRSAPV